MDATKLRLVLLAGLPRTGRTSLALTLRARGWDHVQRHEASSDEATLEAARNSLRLGRDVVVDSKNLTTQERTEWITAARAVADVSASVVICGQPPTGGEAAGLDPEHIRYRETWMSPAATSGMSEDQVKERIHAVMKGLEPSFDLPDTAEGIETLTHVRTPEDLVPVLAWLGNAKQYAARPQPGWSTPAPPNARAAAEAWQRAHIKQAASVPPGLPPAPTVPAPDANATSPQLPEEQPPLPAVPSGQSGQPPVPGEASQPPAGASTGGAPGASSSVPGLPPVAGSSSKPALYQPNQEHASQHHFQQPYQAAGYVGAPAAYAVSDPSARPAGYQQGYEAMLGGQSATAQAAYQQLQPAGQHQVAGILPTQQQQQLQPWAQAASGQQSNAAYMVQQQPHQQQQQQQQQPQQQQQQPGFALAGLQGQPYQPQQQPQQQQGGAHMLYVSQQQQQQPAQYAPMGVQQYMSYTAQGQAPDSHQNTFMPASQAVGQPFGMSYHSSDQGQPRMMGQAAQTHASNFNHRSDVNMQPGMHKGVPARRMTGGGGPAVYGGKRGSPSDNDADVPSGAMRDFKRARSTSGHADGDRVYGAGTGTFQPTTEIKALTYDTTDPRPIILFELAGILVNTSADRVASVTKAHLPRPGLAQLVRLMPHFRLGVYTTAMVKTVHDAMSVIAAAVRGELASDADGWRLLLDGAPPAAVNGQQAANANDKLVSIPESNAQLQRLGFTSADVLRPLRWQEIFDEGLILTREHCEIAYSEHNRRDITVKAPAKLFPEAAHMVLAVDDAASRVPPEYLVAVRKWAANNRRDGQVDGLVAALLEHAQPLAANIATGAKPPVDLRTVVPEVCAAIAAAPARERVRWRPSANDAGYYEEYPVREGAEVCQFYTKSGYCKFLETCTKTHPPELRVKLNLAGFPMRPGRAVCRSYLRDGFCTSIKACSHHHPNLEPVRPGEPDPPNLAAYDPPAAVDVTGDENVHQQTGESTGAPKAMQRPKYVPAPGKGYEVVEPDWLARFPQRPDAAPCADFLRDAFCPRGAACEFHHPLDGDIVPLNNYGLPLRRNEVTCDFFVRTAMCRFGAKCHKHHPYLMPGAPLDTKPTPMPGGNNGPPANSGESRSDQQGPQQRQGQSKSSLAINKNRRTDGAEFVVVDEHDGYYPDFPSNPGAEICPHFKRCGECKFGDRCQYDHPLELRIMRNRNGLPLRPGAEVCTFYLLNGGCGYGAACMKHHPNIAIKGTAPGMAISEYMNYGLQPAMVDISSMQNMGQMYSAHMGGQMGAQDAGQPQPRMMGQGAAGMMGQNGVTNGMIGGLVAAPGLVQQWDGGAAAMPQAVMMAPQDMGMGMPAMGMGYFQ